MNTAADMEEENYLALERIYLRFALAENSAQLSTFCTKHLPTLFEKLAACVGVGIDDSKKTAAAAADVETRDKILELLSRLKRRLRSNEDALLPVDYLLNEYDKGTSALTKNFSFIFLKIGFARLSLEKQVEYAPQFMKTVSKKPYKEQLELWCQFIPMIHKYYGASKKQWSNNHNNNASADPFSVLKSMSSSTTRANFLNFCAQFLLLPENFFSRLLVRGRIVGGGGGGPPPPPRGFPQFPDDADDDDDGDFGHDDGEHAAPAPVPVPVPIPQPPARIYSGVSVRLFDTLSDAVQNAGTLAYLGKNEGISGSKMVGTSPFVEAKISIIRMLSNCGLPSEEVAWIWCLASADSHHSVVQEADQCLKQAPGLGVNEPAAMRRLYEYYLGTANVQTIPQEDRKGAVVLRVQLKLMIYLLRYADTAASIFPQCIQVLFENWFGKRTEDTSSTTGAANSLFGLLRGASSSSSSSASEKLQYAGTEFASHVVGKLNEKTAAIFAPLIFANVKKVMDSNHDPKLGCLCYGVLGKLGNLYPNVVLVGKKRMEMIQELFDDLSEIDNDDICVAAQTCLFQWLDGLTRGGKFKDDHLEACILAYAEHKSIKCRIAALRFIEKLFSINHAPSRYALFLAISDRNEKVRQEADGILKRMQNVIHQSSENDDEEADRDYGFSSACLYFSEKVGRAFEREEMKSDPSSSAKISSGLSADTLKQIIRYLRQRLTIYIRIRSRNSKMEVDDLTSLEELEEHGDDTATGLAEYLGSANSYDQWKPYLDLLVAYIKKYGATDESVLNYVAELLYQCAEPLLSDHILPTLAPIAGQLSDTMRNSTNEQLIVQLADVLSIIYAKTKDARFIKAELDSGAQHLQKDKFLLPSRVYLPSALCEHLIGSSGSSSSSSSSNQPPPPKYSRQTLITFTQLLCDRFCSAVADADPGNLDVTVHCLKRVAASSSKDYYLLGQALPSAEIRRPVYEKFLQVIKSRKEWAGQRLKDGCLEFLGAWMIGEPMLEEQWRDDVVVEIMKPLEGPADIGLQPGIGKLLANYCASPIVGGISGGFNGGGRGFSDRSIGRLRKLLSERLEQANMNSGGSSAAMVKEANARVDWLLGRVMVGEEAERLRTNKNHKQAICLWMETFLRVCGQQLDSAQSYLDRLQSFFISCLAEKDEYTQDVARRCLFLMFRCARSAETRSSLARLMREELTATSAKESLLPFQELCVLCASTCQCPELIYDLMLLALNRRPAAASSGTAKKGASAEGGGEAGISAMVRVAVAKMEVYESILVPLLFRFTYDPIPGVKRVFQNVWASLNECMKEQREVEEDEEEKGITMVEKYSGDIFNQLFNDLESQQWRYREASCVALSDLISGPNVSAVQLNNIGELWKRAFRVLDDMKESVRIAAFKTVKALKKFTLRLCSPEGSPSAVLPIVIPLFVEFGLQNGADLVRLSSLSILMIVIKEAPARLLKPHIPALMTGFLEALTWTEGEKVNYYSVRAAGEEQEHIDQARIAASKSSPITDSLQFCCRFVDASVLESLVPKLVHTLQANVGLATKSGACRLISFLRAQLPSSDLAPFSDTLLKCLTRCLSDRNVPFRKLVAANIGQLAPLCSKSALNRFFTGVERWYLESSENAWMELSYAYALRSIASDAPEILREFGKQVAPVAFISSQNDPTAATNDNDSTESAANLKEIWDEVTAELPLSAYIFDIYDVCARLLSESQSWKTKALSAKTIGVLVEKMDANLPFDKLREIITLLTKSLEGRIWDGKEHVLTSQGGTASKYGPAFRSHLDDSEKSLMEETLLKECQRTSKPKYRVHAITQTGIITESLSLDIWTRIWAILSSCLKQSETRSTLQEDQDSESDYRRASYVALARCLYTTDSKEHAGDMAVYGSLMLQRLSQSVWREQLCILDAVNLISEKKLSRQVFVDRHGLMNALLKVLDQTAQMAVKQRCVAALRHLCDDMIGEKEEAPRVVEEIMTRFLHSDNLNALARDLVQKMQEFWEGTPME